MGDAKRTKREVAAWVLGLLLVPTWLSVLVIGGVCNLGDPLQNGTEDQCHAATANAAHTAWIYTSGIAALLAVALLMRWRGWSRPERFLLGVGLVLALLPTIPVGLLYAAAWL